MCIQHFHSNGPGVGRAERRVVERLEDPVHVHRRRSYLFSEIYSKNIVLQSVRKSDVPRAEQRTRILPEREMPLLARSRCELSAARPQDGEHNRDPTRIHVPLSQEREAGRPGDVLQAFCARSRLAVHENDSARAGVLPEVRTAGRAPPGGPRRTGRILLQGDAALENAFSPKRQESWRLRVRGLRVSRGGGLRGRQRVALLRAVCVQKHRAYRILRTRASGTDFAGRVLRMQAARICESERRN